MTARGLQPKKYDCRTCGIDACEGRHKSPSTVVYCMRQEARVKRGSDPLKPFREKVTQDF